MSMNELHGWSAYSQNHCLLSSAQLNCWLVVCVGGLIKHVTAENQSAKIRCTRAQNPVKLGNLLNQLASDLR